MFSSLPDKLFARAEFWAFLDLVSSLWSFLFNVKELFTLMSSCVFRRVLAANTKRIHGDPCVFLMFCSFLYWNKLLQ